MKNKILSGANMDIDLTSAKDISWHQDQCPWNKADGSNSHRCAIKNISICDYFCGIKPLDKVICNYPNSKKHE